MGRSCSISWIVNMIGVLRFNNRNFQNGWYIVQNFHNLRRPVKRTRIARDLRNSIMHGDISQPGDPCFVKRQTKSVRWSFDSIELIESWTSRLFLMKIQISN
jgi:hypothetical protein